MNVVAQSQTEKYLAQAEAKKAIPLADDLYQKATKGTTVSGIFSTFVEGDNWYPTDTRFTTGIQTSGQALFDWATSQHDNERYGTAIDRYDLLLETDALNTSLRVKVENRLSHAKAGKRPADVIYQQAREERTASGKVALYIEGYETYPTDDRFKAGIQESVQALLDWAKKKQNNGDFSTAIDRYQYILNAAGVNKTVQNQTEKYLTRAEAGKTVPLADELYQKATKGTTVSGIFLTYVEGHNLYPMDTRFTTGIQTSGQALFEWAISQHDNERYDTAIDRYDLLLEVAVLNTSLQGKVENRLSDAKIEKRPADVIYQQAREERTASGKVALYSEGNVSYPEDTRFLQGLNTSTVALYEWAAGKHASRNYEQATDRYNYLLEIPNLGSELSDKISIHIRYSSNDRNIPTVNGFIEEAKQLSTLSSRLDLLVDGYTIYEGNHSLKTSINETSTSLLTSASGKHQAGDYTTAENHYENILSTPGITEEVALEAEVKLSYAKNNNKYPSADELYEKAKAQTSASRILETYVDGYTLYPLDSRFVNGVNEGAELLLNWATKQHQNSRYDIAVDRYDRIIQATGVETALTKEAKLKRKYAAQGAPIPSADRLYNLAVNNTSASGKFDLFEEGHLLYPEDQRFVTKFNSSALNLFIWSVNQHENRRFEVAIERYDKLLGSPIVSDSIKAITLRNKQNAISNNVPTRQIITNTQYASTLSDALTIQMNLSPPPQTDKYRNAPAYIHSSVANEIEIGAISGNGVNIRKSPTLDGDIYKTASYGTAFEVIKSVKGDNTANSDVWYEINYNNETLYVHSSLVGITNGIKVTKGAKIYDSTSIDSHVYTSVSSNNLFSIRSKTSDSNWYEVNIGTWRNARETDVEPILNPDNNDMYQHLVLSKSAGVSATEINKILSGKGILHGKGQVFIDAGFDHSVNEIYLISHALLETGYGSSTLANGIEVGVNKNDQLELVTSENRSNLSEIQTTYNMFGIGAADADAKRLGAFRAYNEKWFTPDAAIIGGAKFIGSKYIHNYYEQNTLYKMRWNPANPGYPQYATDMEWSLKQISNIKDLYEKLENPILEFDIPKYK